MAISEAPAEIAQRTRWASLLRRLARRAPLLQRCASGLLSLAIVVASVIPIARFIGIALKRIDYPYELEWLEGGAIGHIQIVLAGQSIYRAPSIHFTPFLYAPLYYYVSALPSLVLGVGHLAPRLVSFVSALGCFVLMARWVREETGDAVAGVAAAGLLSSVYELTMCWFDLARVDSFFLLLALSANFMGRTARTPTRAVLTGVLIAAACFTKQLGIPLALPALLFVALRSWRLGLIATGVAGGLLAVFGTAFYVTSHGWIYYYLFALPARHHIEWSRFTRDAQTYFLSSTLPLTLCGVALLCGCGFRSAAERKAWLFNALFVGLACTTSFLPFLKAGGYPNGLIPAYAGLALAAGMQLGALRRSAGSVLGALGPRLFACLLVVFQCQVLSYDPAIALPTAADVAANETAVARLQALPKPIWITASSNFNRLADPHGIHLDTAALSDVFAGGGTEADELRIQIRKVITDHRFRTIVLDRAAAFLPGDILDVLGQEYTERGSVMRNVPGDAGWPKTGAAIRPDSIWVPNRKHPGAH